MGGGGEGLYAKRNIPAGTLIAYYNGIRMTKEQRTPYGDTGYAIFVEWAERGRRTGDHMDLPPEVRKILSTGFCLISESPGQINFEFRVYSMFISNPCWQHQRIENIRLSLSAY